MHKPFVFDFSGKRVLVTGGTQGIGLSIAHSYAKLGARLIITGTKPLKSYDFNIPLSGEIPFDFDYVQADFSNEKSLSGLLDKLRSYNHIDVCVNNAGTNRISIIDDLTDDDYNFVADINLRAPFFICREISKIMKKNKYGRIINISSIWSVISKPRRTVYTTTKFGIVGLSKALAVELAPYNILVNSIAPGFVMTDLTKKSLSHVEMDELTNLIPLGRFAKPEEITSLVLFLSSDVNTYITGQNIVIYGGFTVV